MATYYVDATTGSDSDSGLTEALAWQTIAKVNASSFSAGDSVLFNRGDTWTGTRLTIPSSGSSGNHIIFDAYGSGALPIINGDTNTGFWANSKIYLTIKNLHLKSVSGGYGCSLDLSNNILMEDCDCEGGTYTAFSISGDAADVHDITIRRTLFHGGGQQGCAIDALSGGSAYPGPTDILLEDCESYNNGTDDSLHHGYYIKHTESAMVRRCLAHNNAAHGFQLVNGCQNSVLDKCSTYLNGTYGIETYDNLDAVGNRVTNCLIYANVRDGMHFGTTGRGISVLHNTFVNNATGVAGRGISMESGATGNVIKNNLIIQDFALLGGGKQCVEVVDAASLQSNTFDYNCYYYTGAASLNKAGATGYSMAGWQALTGTPDVNSINVDPLIVTEYTDLKLQSGSPCKNAAVDAGVTDDHDGISRPQGALFDMGAYEVVIAAITGASPMMF